MIHNVPLRRRGKHPLLYSSCAIIFAFALTIYPTTVFAVDEPPPVDATTISSPAEGSTAPNTADTTSPTQTDTSVPEPITETIPLSEEPAAPVEDPYILNEATGLWENSTYTWNPTTYQTAPKETPSYSYNPTTNMWDTTQWQYNPNTGTYVESIVSTPLLPDGVTVESLSTDQPHLNSALSQDSATTANKEATDVPTQPKSTFDLFFNASISNMFSSTAISGDASVSGNTLGGDATTGDATAIATIINLLQSSWNYMAQGGLNTFVSSIFGDIFGDIMINPTLVAASPTSSDANISVNATSDAQIANDITLNATSGDADVTKNTEAGNATTGGAYAIANIINSISSYFGSGSSFIGILNIFGDLNGDILVPTELKGLLSSDPSPANITPSSTDSTLTTTTSQSATTTVEATALSGDATVSGNTSGGNATTGDASTALTVLNLTGRQIIGKNALLVFVNVFGNWIGLIVDNPAGTKSAALGDSTSSSTALPSEVNLSENQSIDNKLSLTATSGDATVSGNTSAGNATTGDASTAANVVNILSSNVSLTEWFGILFINIFGDWKGSFGVDTEAGEAPTPTTTTIQQSTVLTTSTQVIANQFASNLRSQFGTIKPSNELVSATEETTAIVASSPSADTEKFTTNSVEPSLTKASPNYLFSTLATLTGLSILAGERIVTNRRRVLQR